MSRIVDAIHLDAMASGPGNFLAVRADRWLGMVRNRRRGLRFAILEDLPEKRRCPTDGVGLTEIVRQGGPVLQKKVALGDDLLQQPQFREAIARLNAGGDLHSDEIFTDN